MYCSYFETRFGSGSVYATDHGIAQVVIPNVSAPASGDPATPRECKASELTAGVAGMLQRYFRGERMEFDDIPVDLDGLTEFRRSVLVASRNLKFGEVCSYGQLAQTCRSPRAARAIGGALAANPVPIVIPCHRVMASDGRLTGYSAPGGVNTKMALLKMEGVEFQGLLVVTNQMVIHRTSSS